jgi:anti-anti-sigma regulatory factor
VAEEAKAFRFEYGDRGDVIVARFHGRIGSREVPTLEQWEAEISDKQNYVVLFDLSDVESFMPGAHTYFVNFQNRLRKKGKLLGICGLNKEVRVSLMAAGIIRENELYDNLPSAWSALEPRVHELASSPSVSAAEKEKQAA